MDQMMNSEENDQVRKLTPAEVNARIDADIEDNVSRYSNAGREEIERRIHELDHEWDIDRALMAAAGGVSLLGMALSGITNSRKWLLLPTAIGGFLVQHAYQGTCAPMSLLRRAGVRTRSEIEREKEALRELMDRADERTEQPGVAVASEAIVGEEPPPSPITH